MARVRRDERLVEDEIGFLEARFEITSPVEPDSAHAHGHGVGVDDVHRAIGIDAERRVHEEQTAG